MTKALFPIIGSWYQSLNGDEYFEIVAIDEESGTIEIQYVDGEITEFDLDSWRQLELIPASPPEDAGAAFENGSEDNWQNEEHPSDLSPPDVINKIEPDLFQGFDEY